ncbi:MAG: hypothetical protein SFV15_10820 [Polyangiaceae bacterium]|nr:hypothetical protein [Polyangiaceae bacterium]
MLPMRGMMKSARVSPLPKFVRLWTETRGCRSAESALSGRPFQRVHGRLRPLTTGALWLLAIGFGVEQGHAEPSKLPPEVGYNYGEVETARIAGTAQSQRALSNSASALYSNPANIVATRVYHIAGLLELHTPEAQRRTLGLAAVDSVTNGSIGAGLGLNWSRQDTEGINRDYMDARLAIAAPVSDSLAIGVGGRYLKLKQLGQGPLGVSLASSGLGADPIVSDLGLDAGATVKLTPEFSIAAVGMNINNPDNGFMPTSASLALGLSLPNVAVGADLTFDFTTWQKTTLRPALGVEALLGDNFPVRAGYRYDEGARSHAVAAGVGYLDTSIGIDIAGRRVVSGDTSTAFMATFTYFLESSGLASSPTESF